MISNMAQLKNIVKRKFAIKVTVVKTWLIVPPFRHQKQRQLKSKVADLRI